MDEELFQEYDSTNGQVQVRLKRFKSFLRSNWKIIAPLVVIASIGGYFLISHVTQTSTTSDSSKIHKPTHHHGHLKGTSEDKSRLLFTGNETSRAFTNFSDVDNVLDVSSITLRHIELHGPSFTKSLQVFQNLEVLKLENVTIHKLLLTERVYLPKLKYFSASLFVTVENSRKREHEHKKGDETLDSGKHKHEKGENKSDTGRHEHEKEDISDEGKHKHRKGDDKSDEDEYEHEKEETTTDKGEHEHEGEISDKDKHKHRKGEDKSDKDEHEHEKEETTTDKSEHELEKEKEKSDEDNHKHEKEHKNKHKHSRSDKKSDESKQTRKSSDERSDKSEHENEEIEYTTHKGEQEQEKSDEDDHEHEKEETTDRGEREHEEEEKFNKAEHKHKKVYKKSDKIKHKYDRGNNKSDKSKYKHESDHKKSNNSRHKRETGEEKSRKSEHKDEEEREKKRRQILKSILFFQKEKKNWDFDNDLANIGVDIRVRLGGTKVLTIAQENGELMLNFPSCEKVLKSLKWMPKVLTLGGCRIHGEDNIRFSTELRYLNLNNMSLTDAGLVEIIQKQPHLKELLLNIPNGTLDLTDIPKSVKFLSLSGMKVKVNDKEGQGLGASSIREFTMSDGVLEEDLVFNFKGVLPEAETVALFNMRHTGSRRKILGNILKTEAARIIVGNLTTISSNEDEHFVDGTLIVDGEEVDEGYLDGIGVPKYSKHFMINFPPKGDSPIGIPLSVHEIRFFHFTLSEKNKVMTFQEFMKVVADKPKQND